MSIYWETHWWNSLRDYNKLQIIHGILLYMHTKNICWISHRHKRAKPSLRFYVNNVRDIFIHHNRKRGRLAVFGSSKWHNFINNVEWIFHSYFMSGWDTNTFRSGKNDERNQNNFLFLGYSQAHNTKHQNVLNQRNIRMFFLFLCVYFEWPD